MITIAWMTWIEILRKRVFIVTLVMTAAFLGLYTFAVHSVAASLAPQPTNQPMDLLNKYVHGILFTAIGLYVSNFTVAYLAIFSSAGTISAEIESGLMLSILPRPLPRWRVYLGKWIGYTIWSLFYGAVMFWTVVLISHAYIPFPLVAESLWKSFGVFELIPATLVTLSILGSLFVPTLGNGVSMTLLFGLGMIGGFIQRVAPATAQAAMDKVGLMTSLLIPTNATYYRMVYELMGGDSLNVGRSDLNSTLGPFAGGETPNNTFLVYTILYIAACLAFGIRKFSKKDV